MTSTIAQPNSGPVEQTNVKVVVRVRPFSTREIALTEGGVDNIRTVVLMEGNTVRMLDHERAYMEREAFEFDHALWSIPKSQNQFSINPFQTQEDVFNLAGRPAVENALAGYHNTIFAYGQTGSGKTHTMLGSLDDEGIAPRVVRLLFAEIARGKQQHAFERVQYTVELSFIEIYNEKVKDLLAIAAKGQGRSNQGDSGYADCRVRFHPEKGTFVEGLMRLPIEDEDQCLNAIRDGMEHRATTSTLMNDTSSRSHAIFQICLTQKMPLKGTSRVSIINLVDLAGSERISMSGVQGAALQEAKSINLSLSTLRRVIDILIENSRLKKGQRPAVPPFRESLLTWVLSDSLGGNSKTIMIAAVSPFSGNTEDTMGTLRYALKAKAIVCNARVNEEKTQAVVNSLRAEMEELRRQLAAKADADEAEQERIAQELKNTEENLEKMQIEAKQLDELKVQYERDLVTKAAAMTHAQKEMATLGNVEEEKRRKEAELTQARQLMHEAEQQLKMQEDERARKQHELETLKSRKKMLQEDHDKAAEEEAKAKLAAEQSRLRQFASAFQNAFILGKQKTGLEQLREDMRALQESIAKAQLTKREKEKTLAQLIADKGLFRRKMDLSQKRAAEIYSEVEAVIASKEDKIAEAKAAREAAQNDLVAAQLDLEGRQKRLAELQVSHDDERSAIQLDIQRLEVQLQGVRETRAKHAAEKEKTIAELDKATAASETLRQKKAEAEATLAQLKEDNGRTEQQLHELKAKRLHVTEARDQYQSKLAALQARFSAAEGELQSTEHAIGRLTAEHGELRQYVTGRFFPSTVPIAAAPHHAAAAHSVVSLTHQTPLRQTRLSFNDTGASPNGSAARRSTTPNGYRR